MIKSFNVKNSTPQEFIEKVMTILQKGELGKVTTMTASGDNFTVVFSKLGKSEIVYDLTKEGTNFSCTFKSEKVAFTHKAFKGEVDKGITKAFEHAGATVVQG